MNEFLTWNNRIFEQPNKAALIVLVFVFAIIVYCVVREVAKFIDWIDRKYLYVSESELDNIDKEERSKYEKVKTVPILRE